MNNEISFSATPLPNNTPQGYFSIFKNPFKSKQQFIDLKDNDFEKNEIIESELQEK